MSLVEQIKEAIELYIGTLLPNFGRSQYNWDSSLNTGTKTKNYYAIKPGSSNFVSGTCNTITIEQDFTLELGDSYTNRKDTDLDADEKIYALYAAHETIYRALMRDNLNIQRVQVISGLSMSEPSLDRENKSVKIEAIFTVRYRTE
jgi:hypothetical protein